MHGVVGCSPGPALSWRGRRAGGLDFFVQVGQEFLVAAGF